MEHSISMAVNSRLGLQVKARVKARVKANEIEHTMSRSRQRRQGQCKKVPRSRFTL
jgi:hypothetical protein